MVTLDTNSYTAYFNKDSRVKREIDKSKKVLMSVVTVGELLYSFRMGSREKSNTDELNDFLGNKKVQFLQITLKTAAIETKSTLITFDRHFLKIAGLKYWKELN